MASNIYRFVSNSQGWPHAAHPDDAAICIAAVSFDATATAAWHFPPDDVSTMLYFESSFGAIQSG
jgi:hypothetical protein